MTRINYSKELLEQNVKDCYSIAELCRRIGLKPVGSNYVTVRKKLSEFNVDYSHFKGQGWNKDLCNINKTALISLNDILKENTNYSSHNLKLRLFKEGIKEQKCEICGKSEWEGVPIHLELHHINGNHYDNRLENLQILCPNCHSNTSNFRNRNRTSITEIPNHLYTKKEKPVCTCLYCGKTFTSDRSDRVRKFCCRDCYNQYLMNNSTNNISKDSIMKVISKYEDLTTLGKHFQVSRNTIKKYLDLYGLLEEFKLRYKFKAKKVRQFDCNMNPIQDWPSITDAEETLGIKSIGKVVNGHRRSAGGYIWRYID